jgi:hypothetical protein
LYTSASLTSFSSSSLPTRSATVSRQHYQYILSSEHCTN